MVYIGIDPGKSGAMAVIDTDKNVIHTQVFSERGYVQMLAECRVRMCRCVLEKVNAMPKQGVTSMFNFGLNFGWIQGVLQANGIPYELVTPQKWKKEFSVTADKNTAISVAGRLYPEVDLRRSERCTKPHDGICEALLMAEYAKRHM